MTSAVFSLLLLAVVVDGMAAEMRLLHAFSHDRSEGFETQGALLRATDNALYGTTLRGGAHGQGVLFKLQPESKAFQVLHHFSLDKTNGRAPGAPLAEGKDGFLYGTTSIGGAAGLGTVFKIARDGTGFTVIHSFTGGAGDGRVPFAGVRQGKDLAWYGTTDEGGTHGGGTVYRFNSDGTGYRVLRQFGGKLRWDGGKPHGTLCEASDGKWYGTTAVGGYQHDLGTVFVLNSEGSGYRSLHLFTGAPQDGAEPFGALIEATDGMLYGTTALGGRGSQGTVFRLRKDGTGFQVIRSFTGPDGRNPYAGLAEAKGGTLFGVTLNGGPHGAGLIFQLARDGSNYKTVFAFSDRGAEGRMPYAGLTLDTDGSLHGTTTIGGSAGRSGSVFRIHHGAP